MTKYFLLGVLATTFAFAQQDADIPPKFQDKIDEEVYQRLRSEYLDLLRGLPADPSLRATAIQKMQKQIQTMKQRAIVGSSALNAPAAAAASPVWTAIGPSPIPNGQVTNSLPVTGRVTAFAIDPTNTNTVYLGSAQGGVYRSKDGGSNWTQIFDQANTSAIGALAIAPSNHTILFVGTGEANGSGDSYAGVGLYRIENADTTATLVGPINPIRNYHDGSGNPQSVPAFQGRSISSIVVHPADPSILWVGAAGGAIGIGGESPFGNTIPPLGMRGLYRLTNATGVPASVAVQKIAVATVASGFDIPNTANRNVDSIVMEPGNPDNLIVWINGAATAGDGGIYRSTNATSAAPTFTQVLTTTTSGARGIFAIYKQDTNPAVIYVADGESSSGRLRVSTDGGATWSAFLTGGRGFCGGQCFYNIGIDVLPGPTTAASDDIIVLGGNVAGISTRLFAKSIDGGATFTESSAGVHADTHFIEIDPTNSATIYHGDDGGVFKSVNGGLTWSSLNNTQLNTVQFSGLAVHPIDPKWSIGGTQDNGTNMRDGSGNWRRVDFGDGGYALVDRNATDTANLTLYHTYFNQTNNLIGFARVLSTACASDGQWVFKGIYGGSVDPTVYCDGSDTFNGILLTDAVMFYAPMELGPGNPSTVYFGAGAVYRSSDKGETMPAVSQRTTSPVSTIAVSPQDDNYRIFGRRDGTVFYTTSGANPMTQLLGIPVRYIARAKFDPSDKETAYVTLGGYFGGTAATQSHIWKVTNLSTAPAVAGINGGLPDVPVNAFAVDPANGTNLFAGTDIGVYNSTDGGLTWLPFGTGLPVVAVFGMEIQAPSRTLRIATHGRGMWDVPIGPAAANAATFLPLDTGTQGNWPGVYGGDGYIIANNSSNQTPNYATVNFTGASTYTWISPAPSSDQRLLRTSPNSGNRIGSTFYSGSNFSVDLTLTGGQHQVALYLLDLDSTTRSETITIRNADDNSVLDTRAFSNFHNGVWAVWTMRGHISIQVANNGGPNGVVAGLFLSTLSSPHSRPIVTIYSPAPNQTVTGTVTLSANVTAAAGVQGVQFVLDNTINLSPLIPGDGATYTYQWNSAAVGNGQHTLQVTGTDNLSETGQSSVTFNVSNTGAPSASAQFVAPADATTQGNWVGKYGNDGFWIANDLSSAPPVYANLNFTGTSAYTWNGGTSDPRALLTSPTGSPSARIASTYYSNTSFTIDLNLNDNQPHLVALYLLDYDDNRAESITVVDANNTSNVLDTQSAANFQNGEYLVWKIQGHVQIQVKTTGGLNGVVSGIFFAPASSGGPQQPPIVTVTAPTPNQQVSGVFKLQATATSTGSIASVQFFVDNNPVGPAITQGVNSTYSYNLDTTLLSNSTHSVKAVATDNLNQQTPANAVSFSVANVSAGSNLAVFVKTDTTTQGNWKGVYGGAGEIIANDSNATPSYAVVNFTANLFTWTFTTDPRALLTAASTSNRIASVFYNAPGFGIDVNFTDGNSHTLALYLLDWDGSGRAETVTIVDAANTSTVLDTRSAAGFANGTYLVWNITGHVKIQINGTAGPNAVVSGLFFQ